MTYTDRVSKLAWEFYRAHTEMSEAVEATFDEEMKSKASRTYRPLAILAVSGEAKTSRETIDKLAAYTRTTPNFTRVGLRAAGYDYLQQNGYLPTELKAEGEDGK